MELIYFRAYYGQSQLYFTESVPFSPLLLKKVAENNFGQSEGAIAVVECDL